MGCEFTNERIVLQAARWYARLAAPDCTDEERAEFERWRQQDPAHAEVYAATEALSTSLECAASMDDRLQAMADDAFAMGVDGDVIDERLRGEAANEASCNDTPCLASVSPASTPPIRKSSRWYLPAAIAAGILAVFVGLRLVQLAQPEATPAVAYVAPAESRRDVTLADGTVVHLDVSSEVSVRMSAGKRQVVLVDGRALFDVARDANRPFTVAAGRSVTTALGTRFQVQREGQKVQVTLAEGSVAVSGDASPATSWSEKLVPGEQISLTTDAQRGEKRAVDAQMVTSWSRGRLVFRGTPLAEALEEVNRYADRKIRLGDPELAQMPVGGNFIAGETDLIVSAFAAALPLRVVDGGAGEIILFRRYKADVP